MTVVLRSNTSRSGFLNSAEKVCNYSRSSLPDIITARPWGSPVIPGTGAFGSLLVGKIQGTGKGFRPGRPIRWKSILFQVLFNFFGKGFLKAKGPGRSGETKFWAKFGRGLAKGTIVAWKSLVQNCP